MERLIGWIDRVSGGAGVIAAWLIVPLIAATCYEVFSRYVLHAPTIWAYELGYMATGANFLLGAAYTLRERGHIRVDVIYGHVLPKRWQAIVTVLGLIFFLLPGAFWLTDALWTYALDAYRTGEKSGQSAWNPAIWPFRMVFFAGFLLLALQGAAEVLRIIRYLTGRDLEWDSR